MKTLAILALVALSGCATLEKDLENVVTCVAGRPEALAAEARALAAELVDGPGFAHGITKTQLNQEWNMGLEQAIEAEAQAQAICMQTRDFERAYDAFVAKEKPVFAGD